MTEPAAAPLLLPTRLAPPISYYRMMALHPGPVAICCGERFDKRCKAAHRFAIADTRGRLELTVPIEKPYGRTWADTWVSLHGCWWELMARALESAYGRTPYFEFYADDFLPLLADPERFTTVAALNADFDRAIRRALFMDREVVYVDRGKPVALTDDGCGGGCSTERPYWQVRADSLGFISGLSVLDLIFNMGPEAGAVISGAGFRGNA